MSNVSNFFLLHTGTKILKHFFQECIKPREVVVVVPERI